MKRTTISLAIIAIFVTLAGSCQKEAFFEHGQPYTTSATTYIVAYTLDAEAYIISIIGEDAWLDFIDYLLTLAQEGRMVEFRSENAVSGLNVTKEKVTFTTSSREEALSWCDKMIPSRSCTTKKPQNTYALPPSRLHGEDIYGNL